MVREDGPGEPIEHINGVSNNLRMPSVLEIQDIGKGDGVAKIITIIQTLWFAVQAAHRVRQDLIVTGPKLPVLAHAILNVFTY